MKRLNLLVLFSVFILTALAISMIGCSSNTSILSNMVSPPSTVSSVQVGGSGATACANSTSVTLYPTVIDQTNTPITNLRPGNFNITIRESGGTDQACTITSVANQSYSGGTPISLSMTLDRSGSMYGTPLSDLKTAAKAFIDLMGSTDELGVIAFPTAASDATFEVIATLEATSTSTVKTKMKNLIDAITDIGLTPLYFSIKGAVDQVLTGTKTRKAVIAMTDGGENSSPAAYNTTAEVISYAIANNIPVFTIGLGTGISSAELTAVASQTGGIYYGAPNSSDLSALYAKISSALNSAYTISITSPFTLQAGKTYIVTITLNYGTFNGSTTFNITL